MLTYREKEKEEEREGAASATKVSKISNPHGIVKCQRQYLIYCATFKNDTDKNIFITKAIQNADSFHRIPDLYKHT